jgi:hypothetical protein
MEDGTRRLYTCFVTSASIKGPNTKIPAVDGFHTLKEKSDDDVEAIWFEDSVVEYFPRDLHKIFPGLVALQIVNCGLKTISRNDLRGLRNLRTFDVRNNELKSLPNDLFTGMKNLKIIDFDGNKLEFVSSQLFKPIMNNGLTYVNFENNTNFDVFYEPRHSNTVTSLEELMRVIDKKRQKPIEKVSSVKDNVETEFAVEFTRGFKNLWTSGWLSDFVIKVGSKEFPVHRNVLSVYSSVFAEIFKKDEQSKEMIIKDLSAEVVEDFLHFLYTGKVAENVNAIDLFAIAANFNVQRLNFICEKLVIESLDQENIVKVFNLAHKYKSDELKKSAFKEITKIFRGKKLPDDLMNDPEKFKKIIEARRNYDSLF